MKKQKVTFDLNLVMFEEIDGFQTPVEQKQKGFREFIARHFYYNTSSIELDVFATALYQQEKVDVNREQLIAISEELANMKLLNPVRKSFETVVSNCLAQLDVEEPSKE